MFVSVPVCLCICSVRGVCRVRWRGRKEREDKRGEEEKEEQVVKGKNGPLRM